MDSLNARRMDIAGNVRAEMARRGITQADMSKALGLSQAAISRRLTGSTPFTADELTRAADALGISAALLIEAA